MNKYIKPLIFALVRNEKIVANGCLFNQNRIALCWLGDVQSIVFHTSLKDVKKIHCADENSELMFYRYDGSIISDNELQELMDKLN